MSKMSPSSVIRKVVLEYIEDLTLNSSLPKLKGNATRFHLQVNQSNVVLAINFKCFASESGLTPTTEIPFFVSKSKFSVRLRLSCPGCYL